jgi:hypothetical protein
MYFSQTTVYIQSAVWLGGGGHVATDDATQQVAAVRSSEAYLYRGPPQVINLMTGNRHAGSVCGQGIPRLRLAAAVAGQTSPSWRPEAGELQAEEEAAAAASSAVAAHAEEGRLQLHPQAEGLPLGSEY